jgi:anti-sigma regulatory factor (Ser/Thr protein kinase)
VAAVTGERWRLPPDPRSVPEARERVETRCRSWGVSAEDLPLILLVTSELVTNAVRHACTTLTLQVSLGHTGVQLEVGDRSSGLPEMPSMDPTVPGGLGLLLVDQLSSDWGVRPVRGGKTVWAHVPAQVHTDVLHLV